MSQLVTTTRHDNVLEVRLANPAGRNSIDLEFAQQLYAAVGDLDGIRAIALLADGDQFCVGGNVRAMAAAEDRRGFLRELADELHKSMRVLRAGPPVVVGARGWAAGAGMSMALSGDVVVAGESLMIRCAYPGLGVSPDGGMSYDLPRQVGARMARSLILRNTAVTAAEALTLGLIDEVVPDDEVDVRALAVAAEFADGPHEAYMAIKGLLNDSDAASYSDQLDAEAVSISELSVSADGNEGIAAFVERRPPVFG